MLTKKQTRSKKKDMMQRRGKVPVWLKRLDLVRDELRHTRFPRTAEEGFRQCAELSEASLRLFKQEIRKRLRTGDEQKVEREARRLMVRFSISDRRWETSRRRDLASSR
jgi:hypothetical protein